MKDMKDLQIAPGSFAVVNGTVIMMTPEGKLQVAGDALVLAKDDLLADSSAANTPTKRIFFVLQSILLDPENAGTYRNELFDLLCDRSEATTLPQITHSLGLIKTLAEQDEVHAAMEICRRLIDLDAAILAGEEPSA